MRGKKISWVSGCLYAYFGISLLSFFISFFTGDPLLTMMILGQAFLAAGLMISTHDYRGAVFFFAGLIMVGAYVVDRWMPHLAPVLLNGTTFAVTLSLTFILVPSYVGICAPILNKRRLVSKNAAKVVGTCVGYDWRQDENRKSFTPIYEFYLNGTQHRTQDPIYLPKSDMPRVGAAAEILVNPKNPDQTYIEQDKAIKIRNAIVSAFCASLGLCVLLLVLVPARYAGVMACVTAILMFSAIPAAILANIFYGRRR